MKNVEELIIESLKEFMNLDCIADGTKNQKNKLVFPLRNNKRRVSEQEIVFLFAKTLEQAEQKQFLYSVETPTTKKFLFKGVIPIIDGVKGVSGNIDICLYENKKRKHLIEFKALNPNQKSYSKDFLKLMYDEEVELTNYFVQVLENIDAGTLPNIERKYETAIENAIKEGGTVQSHLKIFLCDMKGKRIISYVLNGESVEVIDDRRY
ncbi:hypothetical protein EZS27_010533 [termite gut metagenome]|uniref:Uncharacterized protein n=1 Tax=termite gut metagenome TaxID=433724 RepID=A0A5J4S8E4_9ZZZZ